LFPRVQNRCAAATLHITTLSSTSIIDHLAPSQTIMSAHLCKSKTALLELMKTLPDAHIAEEADFVAWGRQFVDATVSQV
jgi:hypothetical protein